jgi:indolepyruvate ferredoxin oxidoreductase alpha subunit
VGDSTFFHNGVTPLLNIVHNGGRSTLVILDNATTAMTGHQDHPGVEHSLSGKGIKVDIEGVVRGCGVEFVRKANAFDVKAVDRAYEEALAFDGPSVVIVEGPCIFTGNFAKDPYEVDPERCTACGVCFRLGCPAIARSDEVYEKNGKRKAMIDPVLCTGCDMCAQVCPFSAIYSTSADKK